MISKKIIKQKFFNVTNELTGKDFELYGSSIEELEGRYVRLDLTRMLRGKGIEVRFKIKVKNKEAYAVPTDIYLMGYFIRRMMHKGADYIEDSIKCKIKNADVVIKPFIITRKKVARSIKNAIRIKTREWLSDELTKYDSWEIFDEILKNKLQKDLSLVLKKIYPLSLCEIRTFEIRKIGQEIDYSKPAKISEKEIEKELIESEKITDSLEENKTPEKIKEE